MAKKIFCIKCDKKVDNLAKKKYDIHPCGGTQFRSYGHYGSTVFDPMDGSYIVICICDTCLTACMKIKNAVHEGVNK